MRGTTISEEPMKLFPQQPPAFAHGRGVVGADGRHLFHPTIFQDCCAEDLSLVLASDRVLARLHIAHEKRLGCGEDQVEDMALLHSRPPIRDETYEQRCRDLLCHLT
eukprot:3180638-Prymnesium_polylepis.1